MAGQRDDLDQRMLGEIGEQARFAGELGYYGIGFTEHHFHVEGFELSTNPILLDVYVGLRTERIKVGQLALVLPAHDPLQVAEDVAILDHMTGGRAYVGFARGYQDRWVNTLAQAAGVGATSSDKSERELPLGEGIATGGTLCLADTPEQAQEMREQFDWLFESWFVPFGFPPGLVFQGTPEQVTKQIDEMQQALGFQELFLWVCRGLFDHQVMMRQLELFANKVAPHFGSEQG